MDKTPKFGPTDDGWCPTFVGTSRDNDFSCFDVGSIGNMTPKTAPGGAENATPDWAGSHNYKRMSGGSGNPEAGKS